MPLTGFLHPAISGYRSYPALSQRRGVCPLSSELHATILIKPSLEIPHELRMPPQQQLRARAQGGVVGEKLIAPRDHLTEQLRCLFLVVVEPSYYIRHAGYLVRDSVVDEAFGHHKGFLGVEGGIDVSVRIVDEGFEAGLV